MQAILPKFTRSTTQGVSHLWVAATISIIALLSGGRAAADSTHNPNEKVTCERCLDSDHE